MDWVGVCMAHGRHILEADRVMIEFYTASLRHHYATRTIGGVLVTICGFYRWAYEEGHTSTDIGAYVRRPRQPRRSNQRWLSRDQLARLLEVSRGRGPEVALAVHLLGLNGLRIGDVVSARVEHVQQIAGATTLLLPHRKGDVLDRVRLPPQTVELLPAAVAGRGCGPLVYHNGKAVIPATVYRWLDQMQDAARLPFRVRPHMLRATFVTLALDAGVPARDIMAATGHASVEMIAYYDRAFRSVGGAAPQAVARLVGSDDSL